MWLLPNGVSSNKIYRSAIKLLRELYRQKNHPFGLKGAETVQNEESFRCPNIYKQEIGRRNYTAANAGYLS